MTSQAGDGEVTLTWTDPTDSLYTQIEITWTPGGTAGATVLPNSSFYIVGNLTNGIQYQFKL
ncbi:MAG: fibronectin type III domain-containing protein [Spirochaetia bacterium]